MQITDIIIILLFIIPGYLCIEICSWLTAPAKSKKIEFKELARYVFWSCPIVFISGMILSNWYNLSYLSSITAELGNIYVLIKFIIIVAIVSCLFGFAGGLVKEPWFTFVNWIRKKILKKFAIDTSGSCWEELFGIGHDAHYLEIIKDGQTISKGFGKHFSFTDEEKELIINIPETWKDYPGLESKFTKVNNTYINLEKGIIIHDYDLGEYKKYCEKLWEDNK